jgi:hypothetical protein
MDLFLASTKAVSTLATLFIVGLAFGFYPRPHGLLPPATLKALSALVMWLLSPCLILSVYATRLTGAVLDSTLTCCAWCLLHILVNFCLGKLALPFAAPAAHHAGAFRAAIIFGNSASLPFLLLAVLVQRPSLRADAAAFDRSVVYCFSYLIPWWCGIYGLGCELLRPLPAAAGGGGGGGGAPAPAAVATDAAAVLKRSVQQPPVVATLAGVLLGLTPLGGLFWGASPPLGGAGAVVKLLGEGSIPCANVVLAGSLFSAVAELLRDARARLGEAPLAEDAGGWAALTSSTALLARALRGRGGGAGRLPLPEEEDAAPKEGEAPPAAAAAAAAAAGEGGSAFFSARTMTWVVLLRLCVSPAICFLLFFAAQRAGVPVLSSADPVLSLVILLQAAMPSAQTMLIVASNVGNESLGRAFALLYMVLYPIATLTLVPWIMLAMSLANV